MSDLIGFCTALIKRAKFANVRYLLAIEGSFEWGNEVASLFVSHHSNALWAGGDAPASMASVVLKKAKKLLGQERDCLVYNAHHGFDAEALGALSGTVVGGGGMIMLLPSSWVDEPDLHPASVRRLAGLLSLPEVIVLRQDAPLPSLPVFPSSTQAYHDPQFGCLTAEQFDAVAAIRRVVTGHRKRPLVLTADRGRGKSSALGIAAGSLMAERNIKIGVTAPSFACADTLFSHVARQLGVNYHQQKLLEFNGSQLQFFAPDLLLSEDISLDFLIVDEAAAIPAPILRRLLKRYNRVAFASTIHGYEGTGRGFAIKFRQNLDVLTPQWRQLQLCQPIRWAENDPLEQWTFKVLLLDADYPLLQGIDIVSEDINYRTVPTSDLIDDEVLLSQVFGLLINAHYQTSPADMIQLLDDDTVDLVIAEFDGVVIGCCLLCREGGFPDEMAQAIMLGKRRPKGHLLAQSVAAHIGFQQAAVQSCARIMRIAVHPELQQQGIGLSLLAFCRDRALQLNFDYLGTSFGLVAELFDFWRKAGYRPIRLGVTKDAASGAHSLLTVLPLSDDAQSWARLAVQLFGFNLQAQRVEQFHKLETELLIKLVSFVNPAEFVASSSHTLMAQQQLALYAQGGLGYDLVVASLELWLMRILGNFTESDLLNDPMLNLAVAKILQRQDWSKIVVDYGFVSRKHAENALRDWVALHHQ